MKTKLLLLLLACCFAVPTYVTAHSSGIGDMAGSRPEGSEEATRSMDEDDSHVVIEEHDARGRFGDESDRVARQRESIEALQRKLRAEMPGENANLEVTGVFDAETRAALRLYQRTHDLNESGELSAETLEKLGLEDEPGLMNLSGETSSSGAQQE